MMLSEATDIVYLKFFTLISAKKDYKLDKLKVQKAKRVQVRAERKFRDIPGILPRPGQGPNSGTVPAIPGRLATLCIARAHFHIHPRKHKRAAHARIFIPSRMRTP